VEHRDVEHDELLGSTEDGGVAAMRDGLIVLMAPQPHPRKRSPVEASQKTISCSIGRELAPDAALSAAGEVGLFHAMEPRSRSRESASGVSGEATRTNHRMPSTRDLGEDAECDFNDVVPSVDRASFLRK